MWRLFLFWFKHPVHVLQQREAGRDHPCLVKADIPAALTSLPLTLHFPQADPSRPSSSLDRPLSSIYYFYMLWLQTYILLAAATLRPPKMWRVSMVCWTFAWRCNVSAQRQAPHCHNKLAEEWEECVNACTCRERMMKEWRYYWAPSLFPGEVILPSINKAQPSVSPSPPSLINPSSSTLLFLALAFSPRHPSGRVHLQRYFGE